MPRTVPWKKHVVLGRALRRGGGQRGSGEGPQPPAPGSRVSASPCLPPPAAPSTAAPRPSPPALTRCSSRRILEKKNNKIKPQKVLFTLEIK